MKVRALAAAGLLCALPAQGADITLSEHVASALTAIDGLPSAATLSELFPDDPIGHLQQLARDRTIDLGIELRVIRSLPAFCAEADCGAESDIHATLFELIERHARADASSREDLLRLRASVEALGATRSGLRTDVAALLPLLDHSSPDVRTAVVYALRDLCNAEAIAPLRSRKLAETSAQVRSAMVNALQDLGRCPANP
jgi:hypothetical protein